LTLFAANFIRRATHWLASLPRPDENALDVCRMGIKHQVQIGAHVSAQISQSSDGKWLRFSDGSVFAGKVFRLPRGAPPPGRRKSCKRMPFFVIPRLIAQMLR